MLLDEPPTFLGEAPGFEDFDSCGVRSHSFLKSVGMPPHEASQSQLGAEAVGQGCTGLRAVLKFLAPMHNSIHCW